MALLRDVPGKTFCSSFESVSSGQNVKSWTLLDPTSKALFVYLVEKGGPGHSGNVTLAVPAQYGGPAQVSRITDPDGCSGRRTGIEGFRVPTNGELTWQPQTVKPDVGKASYTVDLQSCQTALVKISTRRLLP
jgi:hypothetical protein